MSSQGPFPLILASSSRYRRELLARLHLEFAVDVPDVDERALPGETPAHQAARLARAKAEVVAQRHAGALVIGSDQVADLDGRAIGKPGGFAAARAQLQEQSGRRVVFHTALCLAGPGAGQLAVQTVSVAVQFRQLSATTIDAYLRAEEPYDCAGSAKCEGLGIALIERIESDDPTALIGLPLIALTTLLQGADYRVLGA